MGGNLPGHRFFATEWPPEVARPYLEPMVRNLDALDEHVRRAGAELVVLVLPRWFQYDERECPHDWEMRVDHSRHTVLGPHATVLFDFLAELDGRRPYPILSLLEDFRATDVFPTTYEFDPHWTPAGHRVAADGVTRRLHPFVERLRDAQEPLRAPTAASGRASSATATTEGPTGSPVSNESA